MGQHRLEHIIRRRIASEGRITFDRFMQLALYQPDDGYYMSETLRFGPQGDYYTASHLHPIFSWLLAVQLDEARCLMGSPDEFTILEIGAGKGFMAQGIIDYISTHLDWNDRWRYLIVERNPYAARVQRSLLGQYAAVVEWQTSLDDVAPFCGCIISNELLDAFPVHLFQMGGQPREIFVGFNDTGFVEIEDEPSTVDLHDYIKTYGAPDIEGYRSEANLRLKDYVIHLDRILCEGFVITIDYGFTASEYYAPERHQGTLLAYFRHAVNENPFDHIGRQDLTAHVNFSCLRDWGRHLGLSTSGYCSQGSFLASLGIDEIMSRQLATDESFRLEMPKIRSLLFGMGDSHQVLVQYKGSRDIGELRGFSLSNRRHRL